MRDTRIREMATFHSAAKLYASLPSAYESARLCHTDYDVARLMIALDEVTLSRKVVTFETGLGKFLTYIANGSGIWEEQRGTVMLSAAVQAVRSRLESLLLNELQTLHFWLRSEGTDDDRLRRVDRDLGQVRRLHLKLGSLGFTTCVVRVIQQITARETEVRRSDFDTRRDCLGFKDGVYDFTDGQLKRGAEAQPYYVTKTVGYSYHEVMAASAEELSAFDVFFTQIHGDMESRSCLLTSLRHAARKINDQVVLVHHNVATRLTGQSTMILLMRHAFGELMVEEELTRSGSGRGMEFRVDGIAVVVLMPRYSKSVLRLSTAFITRVTGNQSLPNIMCDKMPVLDDDVDPGRVRFLPYKSTFVASALLASFVTPHGTPVYAMDSNLARDRFASWRLCLMRRILETED